MMMDKQQNKRTLNWNSIRRGAQTAVAVGLLSVLPMTPMAKAQDSETQGGTSDNATVLYVHYVHLEEKKPLTLEVTTKQHRYVAGVRSTEDNKKELFVAIDGVIESHRETELSKGSNVYVSTELKDGKVHVSVNNTSERNPLNLSCADDSDALLRQVLHVPPSRGSRVAYSAAQVNNFTLEAVRFIFQ